MSDETGLLFSPARGQPGSPPRPGNVGELNNAVERAVLGKGDEVSAADPGIPIHEVESAPTPRMMTLKEAEKRHIPSSRPTATRRRRVEFLEIGRGTLNTS